MAPQANLKSSNELWKNPKIELNDQINVLSTALTLSTHRDMPTCSSIHLITLLMSRFGQHQPVMLDHCY